LGFLVTFKGVHVNEEKVKACPQTATELKSFYELTTYYCWFIQNFSNLEAPVAYKSFALIEEKLTTS